VNGEIGLGGRYLGRGTTAADGAGEPRDALGNAQGGCHGDWHPERQNGIRRGRNGIRRGRNGIRRRIRQQHCHPEDWGIASGGDKENNPPDAITDVGGRIEAEGSKAAGRPKETDRERETHKERERHTQRKRDRERDREKTAGAMAASAMHLITPTALAAMVCEDERWRGRSRR
jgi:hypothetical protein